MPAQGDRRIEVPILDLRAQYAKIRDEVREAVDRVFESQHFVLGPEVEALEAELAARCGARAAIGCGSGSDALLLALMAAGVGPGDRVVVPTFTFFATAGSVTLLGGIPVFADLDPITLNVTATTIERAAGSLPVKAVVPVHLYGRPCELDPIESWAEAQGATLIEDAAQAIDARDGKGRRIGSAGHLATLSFFPTKNLGGAGEGGMVLTHDEAHAAVLRQLRVHGMEPKYIHPRIGMNARLDAIQAAVLRVKLRHLDAWQDARRENAADYDARFADAGAATCEIPLADGGLPLRTPCPLPAPGLHTYHQYVVRVSGDRRDALRAHLAANGIGSEVYYPVPLHQQPCFVDGAGAGVELPHAEQAAREVLALPVHADLVPEQREAVVEHVVGFLRA